MSATAREIETASVVLGVVAAREHDDLDAATRLMAGYVDDMAAAGWPQDTAWASLAAGAIRLSHRLMVEVAIQRGLNFDEAVAHVQLVVLEGD